MGLFDKIKGAVKAVTGGAAKVQMEYQPAVGVCGQEVLVKITVTSTGGDVKSDGIFIDLRGKESVRINKRESTQLDNSLHLSKNVFKDEFRISEAFVLGAGETQMFEGTFTIPQNIQPSFEGHYTSHDWEIRGRMEARGNDPDTGFQPFKIR